MQFKENRKISFIIVTIVYILAMVVGILGYQWYFESISMVSFRSGKEPFIGVFFGDVLATVFVFLCSLIFKNASVYDPYWSVQPVVILWLLAAEKNFDLLFGGWAALIVVTLWGIRLTANWAYTFKNLNHQDWRYTMLQEKTKWFYPVVNFFGIHLIPTLIVYFCAVPAIAAILTGRHCTQGLFNIGCAIGACISLFATIYQGIADAQLHKFRKNGGKGFIRTGLWKRSRHPNYKAEILMWWGMAIAGFSIMYNAWAFVGATANTLLFLFVSIPMADKRQSRKDGFEEYKNSVPML